MPTNQCGTNCQWWTNRHLTTQPDGFRRFECLSPKWQQELGSMLPVSTTLEGCRECSFYEPLVFPEFEWAVGGITIQTQNRDPARSKYFGETLTSMSKAGFGTGYWFADPPSPHSDEKYKLGPFGNFYQAATRLYLMFPHATAYLIIQDDVNVRSWSKEIIEQIPPAELPPVISLYTAPALIGKGEPVIDERFWHTEYQSKVYNWNRINEGHESPGACCYVFSAEGLRDLLTDPVVLAHKRSANGWRDIDGTVGVWATKFGGIWHHIPPLAEHIGEVSSIDRS